MTHPPFRPAVIHADDDPDESDLVNVPKSFVHAPCGGTTWMSADIVRRYHRKPFGLDSSGDEAWCATCKADCKSADCTWAETGGNMRTYLRGLVAEEHLAKPWAWSEKTLPFVLKVVMPVLGIGLYVSLKLAIKSYVTWAAVIGGGAVAFAVVVAAAWLGPKYLARRRIVNDYLNEFGPPTYPNGIKRTEY